MEVKNYNIRAIYPDLNIKNPRRSLSSEHKKHPVEPIEHVSARIEQRVIIFKTPATPRSG